MTVEKGSKKFEGVTVQECLKNASITLGMPLEKIKYSIIEEKKGLFKKHAIISVVNVDSIEGLAEEMIYKAETQDILTHEKEMHGTIEIQQGKIIIKNPKESGKPAMISP